MRKNAFLAISIVLFLLAAVISLQNLAAVPLTLFGTQTEISLAALTFGSFLAGVLTTMSLWTLREVKQQVSDQKQIEWQKQDEKLAIEIQSDKEKQLEAKIATLEQALKAQIDKSKKKTETGIKKSKTEP